MEVPSIVFRKAPIGPTGSAVPGSKSGIGWTHSDDIPPNPDVTVRLFSDAFAKCYFFSQGMECWRTLSTAFNLAVGS